MQVWLCAQQHVTYDKRLTLKQGVREKQNKVKGKGKGKRNKKVGKGVEREVGDTECPLFTASWNCSSNSTSDRQVVDFTSVLIFHPV